MKLSVVVPVYNEEGTLEPIVERILAAAHEDKEILLAAQQADWGPIQYAGELHDRATYRYFWELLRKAHVTGVKVPDAAEAAGLHDGPQEQRRGRGRVPRPTSGTARPAATAARMSASSTACRTIAWAPDGCSSWGRANWHRAWHCCETWPPKSSLKSP